MSEGWGGGGGWKSPWQLLSVSPSPPLSEPSLPPHRQNFREQKESRLSGTLRFDSHRERRSLSPRLVSFHFRSVSLGTKTCLLILKTALRWYVQRAVQSCLSFQHSPPPPPTKTLCRRSEGPGPPTGSVHHTDVITHNACYHSYSKGFITAVISTFDACLQSAPHMWHRLI